MTASPVLVTGAAGFIGRHVVAGLLRRRLRVRALLLPQEAPRPEWEGSVEVARGDVTDPASLPAALADASGVIHLAAVVSDWGDESLFHRVTVEGTRNLLAASFHHPRLIRFVHASSIVVYGDRLQGNYCHESEPYGRPLGPYSRTKIASERLVWRAYEKGLPVAVVRPGNVFGPASSLWVVEALQNLRRGVLLLCGKPSGNAGLAYVAHVADALIEALTKDEATGEVFNVVDPDAVCWRRYLQELAAIGDIPVRFVVLPFPVAKTAAAAWEGSYRLLRVRRRPLLTRELLNLMGPGLMIPADKIVDRLGFNYRFSHREAMRTTAEWAQRLGLAPAGATHRLEQLGMHGSSGMQCRRRRKSRSGQLADRRALGYD